jgi:large subunit ribosomal protein L23
MDYTRILLKPVVTEKSTLLKDENNQVAFYVADAANKIEVKKAVEKAFNVEVLAVRVVRKQQQVKRRFGRVVGKRSGSKKAYIQLAPGNKIDYFEGV